MKRLRKQVDELDRWMPPIGGEIGDSKAGAQKRKKDKERCMCSLEKLKAELGTQQERHKHVMARLCDAKDEWFSIHASGASGDHCRGTDSLNMFLQHCIFPRCVFSPADAVYCAKFVQQINAQGTSYFSTLQYYDKAR